jgi:hypothetical protein
MGSIQLFPRALPRQLIAQAWRTTPLGPGTIRVREARPEDYAAVRLLQRRVLPCLPALTLRQWESRLHGFGAGQLVATCDGHVVGAAGSLIVRWDEYGFEPSWKAITGDGTFTTHDVEGRTLFAADVMVDPAANAVLASRALFQARRRLCRHLNLRRMIATARMPGYGALRDELTPEVYAMRVIWGDIADPAWRLLMAQGFQYCGILRNHQPGDLASCGNAALLAWLNPLHAPPGPPAAQESQRARKCA